MHEGIDIATPAGTPIRAAAQGVLTFAGWPDGYANYLCVTHSARLTTCYARLSRIDAPLGARLRMGDILGAIGCTGRCFGDDVHFETRRGPIATRRLRTPRQSSTDERRRDVAHRSRQRANLDGKLRGAGALRWCDKYAARNCCSDGAARGA